LAHLKIASSATVSADEYGFRLYLPLFRGKLLPDKLELRCLTKFKECCPASRNENRRSGGDLVLIGSTVLGTIEGGSYGHIVSGIFVLGTTLAMAVFEAAFSGARNVIFSRKI
jgi:hypothetical protein